MIFSGKRLPRIAITMGDPAGVGPELILHAIRDLPFQDHCQLVVFGSDLILKRCQQHLGWSLPDYSVISAQDFAQATDNCQESPVILVDDEGVDLSDITVGAVSATCGAAAYRFIDQAIQAAMSGQVQAVTTAPINKEALHAAGYEYPGHTEIFAERASAGAPWCMMQYSPTITCTFVTVHCGYAEVPGLLSEQRVLDTIQLTDAAIRRIRKKHPRLLVCGLNPHAGEQGLFGNGEEQRIIQPAINRAIAEGIIVDGPVPADTAFLPKRLAEYDAVVCMYHDQGHIPVKALAFDSAVNTTLGLSIVRTSVDHGTAFDIAWKGQADPGSLFSAIRLAVQLSDTKSAVGETIETDFNSKPFYFGNKT